MTLEATMNEKAQLVVHFLGAWFEAKHKELPGLSRLRSSVRYSLLQEGGKRFRPVLAMMTAEALGTPPARILPYAAAVECVHTYSLIHDDLPAMDNDDFRRGQPTNHKKFDEATAILAGDALLTEAFEIISSSYSEEAGLAGRAISELARASGLRGMVGGQAVDMAAKKESISLEDLRTMHSLKTGALIRASAVGAAILSRATEPRVKEIANYAECLGLAFQVADDLLDYDQAKPEPGSYPALLGPEKTKAFLCDLTDKCIVSLKDWTHADPLIQLALYNQSRSL
ncbi:MAG: polyprenyl synthetase family protein [Bdellovibrionota bacterium]